MLFKLLIFYALFWTIVASKIFHFIYLIKVIFTKIIIIIN